ncbi:MAG TPA: CsiV family protein [Gammaproteobacteria bacterium]
MSRAILPRMMRIVFAAVVALLGVALARPGAAQDADPPPLYQVEVLIFANTGLDPTEEDFSRVPATEPAPAPVPRLPGDIELAPLEDELGLPQEPGFPQEPEPVEQPGLPEPPADAGAPAADLPPDPRAQLRTVRDYRTGRLVRFRPLRADELELRGHYRTLERLGAYQPLVHTGWLQEALSEAEATPVDLSLLGIVNPAGSIKLHLSRFLHLTLDLAYQGASGAAATPSPASVGGLGEVPLAPRYVLQASRRIRNAALNYFDHPAFGVLVMVRFVDAPVPPAAVDRPVP